MVVDDHLGIGKATTNVGFGCGRLVGRDGLRESTRLVETALELGIRHFDVAPSYGMGTAEEVLGAVLATVPDVTICTKVGIPRPEYSRARYRARGLVKRIVPRRARQLAASPTAEASVRLRSDFVFSEQAIRDSLAGSLERLRRESVELFLLHEPGLHDLESQVAGFLDALVRERAIAAYGVGIDAVHEPWAAFGSVWQSRLPVQAARRYEQQLAYVFHGALRYSADAMSAGARLRAALAWMPGAVVLVSTSSRAHLKELLQEV